MRHTQTHTCSYTTSTQQSLAKSLRCLPCPLVMSQQFTALLLLFTHNTTTSPKSLKKHLSVLPERDKTPFYWGDKCNTFSSLLLSLAMRRISSRLSWSGSQIQGRQLETPLSTVDSSEVVGPKAARTLGSVGFGYKAPPVLILHLCSLLDEPHDLNQNFMSQLIAVDTNGCKARMRKSS